MYTVTELFNKDHNPFVRTFNDLHDINGYVRFSRFDYDKIKQDPVLESYYEEINKMYQEDHNNLIGMNKNFFSNTIIYGISEWNILLGFISVSKSDEDVLIAYIRTRDNYLRKRIGETLLSHVIGLFPDRNIKLQVSVLNTGAIALYKKLGFKIVGKMSDYYRDYGKLPYTGEGVDAYIMVTKPGFIDRLSNFCFY